MTSAGKHAWRSIVSSGPIVIALVSTVSSLWLVSTAQMCKYRLPIAYRVVMDVFLTTEMIKLNERISNCINYYIHLANKL